MKLSEKWLREFVNPKIDTQQLSNQLTMAGLEVDTVTPAAPDFSGVVVGQVKTAKPHPDAKRLNVCEVDVGAAELLPIVCGGVNVRAGLKVAVATVGAVLPGDFKIKKAKLRGEPSCGMICSSQELGLGEGNDPEHGILELLEDAPVGEDFREYWQLDDQVIDIELTPNRGDCASLLGIARDVAVMNQLSFKPFDIHPIKSVIDDVLPVKIKSPEACPRYVGRIIKGINANAITPLWMQERLRRGGIRCIHPVVDVGNYVMLELGQPMHAFDLAKLSGAICVRQAKKAEPVTLIDGQEIRLEKPALVIADQKGVQAIAGVMGALGSAVDESTQDIFLESAFFAPKEVCLSARHYSIQSDSSYRFERGVDCQLQVKAMERATALLLEIVGGQPGPIIEACDQKQLPKLVSIKLREKRIAHILGVSIQPEKVFSILMALGMEISEVDQGWLVQVPSYRFDITQEIDLIEELARIYGYDHIPTRAMCADLHFSPQPERQLPLSRIRQSLIDRGYHEAITYSFIAKEQQQVFDPKLQPMSLANPLASEMSVMRTSLWPGLLQALLYNQNRQQSRIRLFETGLCFREVKGELQQVFKLAAVVSGNAEPEQWGVPSRKADFYDVKGDIESILRLTGCEASFAWEAAELAGLHPGQTVRIKQKDQIIGCLGVLHPEIAQQMDLNHVTLLFELMIEPLEARQLPEFQPVSKFPSVRRDLALLLDESVSAALLEQQVVEAAGQLLHRVQIFDVYQGEHIESGKKSVALGLTFQDRSRTLQDDEINEIIQGVVSVLERKLNATLRK